MFTVRKTILMLAATAVSLALLSGCAGSPEPKKNSSAQTNRKAEPAWVSNPRSVYPEAQYVSATGFGPDRETAEKNALGSLIAIFGQNVVGETTTTTRYTEAVREGTVAVSEDSTLDQAVKASFDFDTVVGAEIKDVWDDGSKTIYAVAVMDRMKATLTYSDLIDSNEKTIKKLTDIPEAEKDTLDAFARYDFASELADANGRFLNLLSVVNPASASSKKGSVTKSADLRVEKLKIAQRVPIAVKVANDRDGRIRSAFAAAITEAGFRSGGDNARYVLDGTLQLAEAVLQGNPNKFVRYTVDARLTDTKTGAVLLPYSINGREGHSTVPEAENRAVRAAEAKIKGDYNEVFTAFLVQLSSN